MMKYTKKSEFKSYLRKNMKSLLCKDKTFQGHSFFVFKNRRHTIELLSDRKFRRFIYTSYKKYV